MNVFRVSAFTNKLHTRWLGHRCWYFRELPSTSDYLKEKNELFTPHGLICLTDRQTGGKGQFGRTWVSEADANLTFSVVLKPRDKVNLQTFNLMAALSVVETIEEMAGEGLKIKWPNDICHGDWKLGGLLAEATFTGNELERVILGAGLNVNQTQFDAELQETATSLRRVTGGDALDREALMSDILHRMEAKYEIWEKGDQDLIRDINRHLEGYGEWVYLRIEGEDSEQMYKLLGINENGLLHVLDESYELQTFTHEQVRVRSVASPSGTSA